MDKATLGSRRQASRVKRWAWAALVLAFLPATAWGTPTTSDQVRQVMQNWRKLDPRPLGAVLGAEIKKIQTFADGQGVPLYYVVSLEPAGFVIVSGDDLVEPIIAFSPRGEYDPSPVTTLGALVSQDVPGRVARARGLEPQARLTGKELLAADPWQAARRKWGRLAGQERSLETAESPTVISDERVPPLLKTAWGQGGVDGKWEPRCYNYYTPTAANPIPGYPCGCVATAMAQIMRYFCYPYNGVGSQSFTITIDGYPTQEPLLGGDGSGGPYNWQLMVPIPMSSTPENQRAAIGALTHDAGVAVGMDYLKEGSGVSSLHSDRIEKAFKSTFRYSNISWGCNSGSNIYPIDLNPMINPSLDARLPVLLNVGQPSNPIGHSLVADGYGFEAGTLYHHLNLGAEGSQDAWYNLPTIDSNPSYSMVTDCFYNIYPGGNGEIISGRVMDPEGRPLYQAAVWAAAGGWGQWATTDARGIFAFPQAPGNASITVQVLECPGYQPSATRSAFTGESVSDSIITGNVWGVDFGLNRALSLNEALDSNTLVFTTGGDAAWVGDTSTYVINNSSGRSGAVGEGKSSWLETSVTGPGTLKFWAKAESDNSSSLTLSLDGIGISQTFSTAWTSRAIPIPAGTHTFRWSYVNLSQNALSGDFCWVDGVELQPGVPPVSLPPLLAYFPLDGNANDASGNGRHGSINGATPVTGLEGGAYSFDGTPFYCYIHVPLNINPSQVPRLTMGAWVNPKDTGGIDNPNPQTLETVLSCDNGGFDRTLCLDNRGGGYGWSAFCGTGGVLGSLPINAGLWSFVAVVYDQEAGTVTLYADNNVITKAGTLGDGFNLVRIGENPGFGVNFNGVIDNVFFFGDALTAEQIGFIRDYGSAALLTAVVDVTPPQGSVNINGGAAYTNSQQVTLLLPASDNQGVTEMRLKNDDDLYWTDWQPYQAGITWTLNPNDGPKTVWAQFRDAAGNESPEASANIYLDGNVPVGTMAINNDAPYTTNPVVTLTFTADDWGGSGVGLVMVGNNPTGPYTRYHYPLSAPLAHTLSYGDGPKSVYAKFVDRAGNESPLISASIILDANAPTGTVAIQGGAAYTRTAAVTLNLSATDTGSSLDQMQFSNDNATWSALETYAATKAWTLSSGDGTKTVYARFTDKGGNVSAAVSDTIMLDTGPPTGCAVSINNGVAYTKTTAVTLNLAATDAGSGLAQMQFSHNNSTWSALETYAATKAWTLASGDGTKTVYARFTDKAGNVTAAVRDSIVLDTTPPTGTVAIQGGAAYTRTTAVTLNLSATDTGSGLDKMQFSHNNSTWSALEAYAASKAWTLASGDGTKTVYARFTDKAGNVSAAVRDSITLDATPPTGTIAIRGGAYTRIAAVVLNLTSAGGATQMCFSANKTSWSAWEAVSATKQYNLAAPDGLKWVYVKYRDAAGNESAPAGASVTLDTVAPKDGTLKATGGSKQVTLAWSGFSDATSGLNVYRLYYSASGYPTPTTGTKIYEGAALTFTQKNLANGQRCYYRLCAVDKAGNVSAGATAAATPQAGGALPFLELLLDN